MIKPTGDCEYRPEQAPKFIQSEKTWQKKIKTILALNYFLPNSIPYKNVAKITRVAPIKNPKLGSKSSRK